MIVEAQPLVTIAIPTYNGAKYLDACVTSAREQSYTNVEILVIDDGSSDDTLAIARSHAAIDGRIRIIENPRRLGLSGNFTACLKEAAGSWVKYLLQDDLLDPACVEAMVDATSFGCPLVICGRRYRYDGVGSPRQRAAEDTLRASIAIQVHQTSYLPQRDFCQLAIKNLGLNIVGEPVSVLLHRATALALGAYDDRFLQMMDLEYYVRLGAIYGAAVIPQPLATFRCHPDQATETHLAQRRVHTMILDHVLYVTTLAYSPRYCYLREVGLAESPPVDLTVIARRKVYDAWRSVRKDAATDCDGTEALALWRTLILNDPIVGHHIHMTRIRLASRADRLAVLPARLRGAVGRVLRFLPNGDAFVSRVQRWRRERRRLPPAPPSA